MFGMKNAMVKETLIVNLQRGVAAGLVWMIVFLIKGSPETSRAMALMFPIGLPIGMITVMPIISGFFRMLTSMGVPFMGLGNVVIALLVVPGDPLMYILHKIKPELVPVQDYKFLTWNPFIIVMKSMEVGTVEKGKKVVGETSEKCPHKGRVLADKDAKVLGFNWTAKQTVFEIHDDWTVTTPTDRSFGWIDANGGIHKGRPLGKIDPKATLSSNVMAKIQGSGLWVGNEKVGELVV
jgi:hypothetical protein